ncbi:hypothetical protein ACFQ5D_19600 [Paenibacillus farraposensis]|uniref:Uncharacterized protein n=1 Tax=Paenibacillus farraposensis TaxID=2807095 RepID=A0ABW4DHU4_9BACL|nr:hypothetical protein [Paenibacillus farraposensis]MCC3378576.1 hypothetical protein [Paenibacillus farraposensis]
MLDKKVKVSGVACLLFLAITSSAYADASVTSSTYAVTSVTSDAYSKVPTQENHLIHTMGTTKSYSWNERSAPIYCNGKITVHTFPNTQGGDYALSVAVYKVGDTTSHGPWTTYTLQNGSKYNNNVTLSGLYGYFEVSVTPGSDNAKGTFYVDYH